MSKTTQFSRRFLGLIAFVLLSGAPKLGAVEALLLQDTYVDNGTSGKPVPNATNYGAGADIRVFKGGGRVGRTFLKFTLASLPPGTTATDVTQARLRLWVNSNSTLLGAVTMTPVTSAWDELTLKDNTSASLTFGLPKIADLPVSYSSNFISIDVTDWVKAWLNGTLANEGFMIEAASSVATLSLAFDSKESSLTSHEPRLEISLSKIGPPGPAGSPGPQGTQGLTGTTGPVGPTGATGPQGTAGAVGPQGPAGQPGATGPQGQSADLAGTDYNWTTDTTDSWLENGDIRLNAPIGEGFIYLSDADVHGADQEIFVETMLQSTNPVKGYFVAVRPDNPRWMKMFAVTSGVEAGGYYRLGVMRIVEVGGTWPNNTPVKLTFIRNGDKGDKGDTGTTGPAGPIGQTGAPGPQGAVGPAGVLGATGAMGPQGPEGVAGPIGPAGQPGATGPQGQSADLAGTDYNWTTDTTDSWLENGDIRLNAPIGEGFIYLSDADVHGADQEIFVETMLQSTNPVKGYFVAVRPDNPRWMKMFAVTSGVEAGGYYRLGVMRIVEVGGTWPNNTPVKLTFIRNGDKGDAGAAGPQGAMGPAGPIGPKGDTGAAGATGDAGPIGPMGAQGPIGPMGLQGIEGPQGIAGTNGAKWYSWSGSPVQALGVLGDYYLDVVTGDVWQKVSNEGGPEWAVQGNIRGADGAVGAKGENGETGPIGPQGPAGPAGLTGSSGPIGPQGPVGPGGDAGAAGPAGPQGPPGPVLTRVDAQGDLSMGEFTQGPTP